MKQKVRKILLTLLLTFIGLSTYGQGRITNLKGYEKLRTELLQINNADMLTDWDVLILAICWKESTFNRTTNENYHGYMQMSRVYVKEVNRLAKTSYTYADARSFKKSVEMHNLMNKHKNPSRELKKAVKIHNGRPAYYTDLMKKFKLIKEYEKERK